jgi:hypothetical protein
MLRADPDDSLRQIGLCKVNVGDGRNSENSIQLLRPDDATERANVLPVIPEAKETPSLVAYGKSVQFHLVRYREGRAVAAHNDKMNLPASPNPAVAEIRDHPLGAATEVDAVYVDADFHLGTMSFTIRR